MNLAEVGYHVCQGCNSDVASGVDGANQPNVCQKCQVQAEVKKLVTEGWICARCGSVFAPEVESCVVCRPRIRYAPGPPPYNSWDAAIVCFGTVMVVGLIWVWVEMVR